MYSKWEKRWVEKRKPRQDFYIEEKKKKGVAKKRGELWGIKLAFLCASLGWMSNILLTPSLLSLISASYPLPLITQVWLCHMNQQEKEESRENKKIKYVFVDVL